MLSSKKARVTQRIHGSRAGPNKQIAPPQLEQSRELQNRAYRRRGWIDVSAMGVFRPLNVPDAGTAWNLIKSPEHARWLAGSRRTYTSGMRSQAPEAPRSDEAPILARSSRSGEATGAVRGATPFRSADFARFVQGAPDTIGVEVLGVDRRTGLLPPGLVQTAGIDTIKA
jgi:hypothetical protein